MFSIQSLLSEGYGPLSPKRQEEVGLLSHFYYTSLRETYGLNKNLATYGTSDHPASISTSNEGSSRISTKSEDKEKDKDSQASMSEKEKDAYECISLILNAIQELPRNLRRAHLVRITDRKVIALLSREDRSDRERELCKLRQSRYRRRRKSERMAE
jgi:hypothetical protein